MKVKLSSIVDIISGGTPKTSISEYWNGDIPWISIVDFASVNKYVDETEKTITQKGLDNSSTKLLYKNDIIISARGTVGCLAMLRKPMTFNQSCFGLRGKKEFVEQDFLYYYLKNYLKNISNKTQGSVFETINLATFDMLEVDIPDKAKQKSISKVLSDIDYKIYYNNKIISELESMSKTIYDYWFNQFEFPNEEGKPYKSSGGKMVWNDELKKEIPEGWEVVNIMKNHLCKDIKAGIDNFEGKKNYLPTANINFEQITDGDNITYLNRESRANMQPRSYSVWFAKMKNSIKHLSIPGESNWFNEKYILSTGFQGLECTKETFAFIHCFVNQKWFETYKDTLAHGATQESVNNEDLKNIKFAEPVGAILDLFSNNILPILEKKFTLFRENQELAKLRDFLLPLLMNGQAKIEDYEQI